jgi:hypothetical protein
MTRHPRRMLHRRALYAVAWTVATICGAAACLMGIDSAINTKTPSLAFEPPPITPRPTPSQTPTQSATLAPTPATTPVEAVHTVTPSPSMRRTPPPPATRAYDLRGGRVVLLIGPASAHVVQVHPRPGCAVQTWTGAGWLRVDFSCGLHGSAFYVTWNGTPPQIQSYNF